MPTLLALLLALTISAPISAGVATAPSAADDAGLAKGVLILELGGQPTPTVESLSQVLNTRGGSGTVLPAVVERRGQRLELVTTLLEWAARDNDRTMLFGARLEIKL